MKYSYLLIDLCTIAVPVLFSFHPKLNFYKKWKSFFIATILSSIPFIIWDIIFTEQKIWGFNPDYLTGIYFFKLPIEEFLFFICIPFSCVFTYHCLNIFFKNKWNSNFENIFVLGGAILLLVAGIVFQRQSYSAYTFISLSLLLLLLKFGFKVTWLPKLFSIYPILLFPFIIVNGILTGTALENPIVWYNDNENLGIRLLTIPIEDFFYGFELILLNIFIYEFLNKKFAKRLQSQTEKAE
ncbi:MAG: lycopene cyclase domain-containing protein [Bacteroidetes bacterium]|nr:lycopene cyclase domain-containing protein [Bacteroidota bacterium]